MRILLLVDYMLAHLLPALEVAEQLERLGHEVEFVGPLDSEAVVREAGFRFHCVFTDMYPRGRCFEIDARRPYDARCYVGFLDHIGLLVDGRHRELVDVLRPDAIAALSFLPLEALTLHYLHGLPLVMISVALIAPPIVRAQWYLDELREQGIAEKIAALAARRGSLASTPAEVLSPLQAAHVRLSPREFEFPDKLEPDTDYVAGGVTRRIRTEQKEPDLPDTTGRVAYVSLGSEAHLKRERNLAALVAIQAAAAELAGDGWTFWVSAPAEFGLASSASFMVRDWFPQVSAIQRADLVLTHGGLGTIRECMRFGRPMLVLPRGRDQFENAARVQRAGLGVDLGDSSPSPARLIEIVKSVVADPSIAERCAHFARAAREADDQLELGRTIERAIQQVASRR
jgi:zeaxanthin glucosyltransferase